MKISYTWLQSYFEEKLPEPEKLAERITFSFAEIESIETIEHTERDGTKTTRNETEKDYVFDIKVLPDRACYALSHRGVAYEVSAITGLKKKEVEYHAPEVKKVARELIIQIKAPELCQRYMARVVENVTQKEMSWVKEHLEAMGQRSINPIVDGANIVMFDRGQPLHAFDADKVEGGIIVRMARKGEKIVTLDNREVNLDESVLVIADEKSPLAIAGIKGGKKAEVTSATKNLILESASFNASYIRKTSERLGIRTDASKRYENRYSSMFASKGMGDFSAYLFEMDKSASFGEITDWYPNPVQEKKISISPDYIAKKLGAELTLDFIEESFGRLLIKVEKKGSEWILTPPVWRADLIILEDISEEVGRILGYDKIPSTLPPVSAVAEIPKSFYYEWKIREALVGIGFSEVMTSSFCEKGSVAIEKPLAEDKKYARENLRGSFEKALKMNALNAPLFGQDEALIFEIGTIFTKDGERTALAIGVAGPKKRSAGVLEATIKEVSELFGTGVGGETKNGVYECMLNDVFEKLPEPTTWNISIPSAENQTFAPYSLYPFIVRDIALFVSSDTTQESVASVIRENAGDFVVRGPVLFDEFEKEGKKSLAFRLVFQSPERTLTDEEVNAVMKTVYDAIVQKGWEIR
ncbi:MAG: hypothetical protein COV91_04370 [Candidatus Taylorbacteria bacterium CG11_big_fil_rev_8_21_14_0_20_46_11]|uniref:phenylalanine--tRNA ligase n=1 Tax=Candidatus Taylorbacteria bacterium CG11_big_fil_rev_8_21_14_0_20_46_11 TaxID=1975025 RepID=A0A2H0KDB5_9BACT|nr:MAG: hypothetical protein COV91_04370 [Candidatus Taylorbacteria bacterium CG11_big_fil_rev_8_21_14_0_20_46_11]